jgi:hypothetical protein
VYFFCLPIVCLTCLSGCWKAWLSGRQLIRSYWYTYLHFLCGVSWMLPTVEVIEFVCRHAAARMASSWYCPTLNPQYSILKGDTSRSKTRTLCACSNL